MTGSARHFARRRQARVEKYVATELRHGRKRRDAGSDKLNRIWVFAGQTLRFTSKDGAGQKAGAENAHKCAIEHVHSLI
jgi:hypothetical protein